MNDHALNALLAEFVAPPVPAGLAGRVAAAALALPQEPRLALARRTGAMPRHDRRGKWLRRPLLLGGLVLGLTVSGAVAATLAGVRLDRLPVVEAVLAKLPFVSRETPIEPVAPPRAAPVVTAPPAIAPAPAEESAVAAPRQVEPPAPRNFTTRDEAPPVAAPPEAPLRLDPAPLRPIVIPPLPPPPVLRDERPVPASALEPRVAAPDAGEEARLRQERIERLRAARQAQIERLQRIQQRRERIRRLRRD